MDKSLSYVKPERIFLADHPQLNERWIQERIAEDPKLLGLGDLVLKDKERIQPKAGRLDLLFQDIESLRRYEVEIQLGHTNEGHIIRTLEYWDIERKRYPQYEHTAVIVAEDITARFLNVISLFNGFIPLIAIQMRALRVGPQMSLVFTTVLDQVTLGLVDEDEEVREVTDRAYWEQLGTPETVAMADQLFAVIKELDPGFELKYNKFYIGLAKNGSPNNFATFRPQKSGMRLEVWLPRSQDLEQKLENAGLDLMEYSARWGTYRIRLSKDDLRKHSDLLADLLRKSYARASAD
jgi:predicted transport protein